MSAIYLVRHGQAGTRDNYDALSDVGREQARLLGRYFIGQRIAFHRIISGSLVRQRATAEIVREVYRAGEAPLPDLTVDPQWNEFDLSGLYAELAPKLCADDSEFRLRFEVMQAEVAAAGQSETAPIHRRWNDCDMAVVRAWIDGRYETAVESWPQFQQRIAGCLAAMAAFGDGESVAVFTSATPIGILTALTVDAPPRRALQLAGVMMNTAVTSFHVRPPEVRLFSFNATAHLEAQELRTFR